MINGIDEEIIKKIEEALDCNSFEAMMVVEVLEDNNLTEFSMIKKDSTKEDNSLLVTSENREYAVGIDKKMGVYSIKDLAKAVYIYTAYQ